MNPKPKVTLTKTGEPYSDPAVTDGVKDGVPSAKGDGTKCAMSALATVSTLKYADLREIVKGAIQAGMERLGEHFEEQSPEVTGGEVPNKSCDGFIPTTEGGWSASAKFVVDFVEEGSEDLDVAVPRAVSAMILASRLATDRLALDAVKDSSDWPEVLRVLGKSDDYHPERLVDVEDSLFDLQEKVNPDEKEAKIAKKANTLLTSINETADESNRSCSEEITFELTALCFDPENHRNEVGEGKWEVRCFGVVSLGEPFCIHGNKVERIHVDGPDISVGVGPGDDHETVQAKVQAAFTKIVDWMTHEGPAGTRIFRSDELAIEGLRPGDFAFRLAVEAGERVLQAAPEEDPAFMGDWQTVNWKDLAELEPVEVTVETRRIGTFLQSYATEMDDAKNMVMGIRPKDGDCFRGKRAALVEKGGRVSIAGKRPLHSLDVGDVLIYPRDPRQHFDPTGPERRLALAAFKNRDPEASSFTFLYQGPSGARYKLEGPDEVNWEASRVK